MASSLTTSFNLNGPLNEDSLSKAREQLSALGVTKLDNADGILVLVTYDPSRITYSELLVNLKSFGIPV